MKTRILLLSFFCLLALIAFPAALAAAEDDALRILSTTPQGDLNALDDGQAITITFDRPIVSLSGVEKDLRDGPLRITPEIPGRYRWMGTSTLSFLPDEPLAYSTRYVVTVQAPITAMDGATLTDDTMFSFVTPRPEVERKYPYQDQEQVTLQEPYFIRFNQAMDPKVAAQFFTLTTEGGTEVPVMVGFPDEEDLERETPYWLREGDTTTLKILPQHDLTQETTYYLRIKAGVPGAAGTLGMKQSYELRFRTYNYFRADGIEPGSYYCGDAYHPEFGVVINFSNAVDRGEALQHLSVTPAITMEEEEEYSYETSRIRLSSGFKPNTEYTITLASGLQDIYGNTLDQEQTYTVTTVDYAPYLSMPSGRMISEAYLGTRFPVKIMNVYDAPLRLKAYRTPEDILGAVKAMRSYDFEVSEPDIDRIYRPNIKHNAVATMPFDLSEALHDGEETGILGMRLEYTTCWGDPQWYNALIFLTNLSATAKFSADNNLFWVTQLQDSAPVEGAEIELYDEQQRFLWQGETDGDGFLETPGWKDLGMKATDTWDQPWVFALIRSGDDQIVIHSQDGTGIWPYRFGISYQQNSEHLTNDGYLFTERGIYRPGEEVDIVGIIRDKVNGEFVVPEALEMDITVTDPNGDDVYAEQHTLSEFGSVHFPLKLADNAKIGTYRITCTFPLPDYYDLPKNERDWVSNEITGSFKVEMYRPVEFEVNIDVDRPAYIKGDTLTADIGATYLFGGALREVPVRWNLNRSSLYFSPEGEQWNGYTFTTTDREWDDQVADGKEALDADGAYAFEYPLQDETTGSFTYSLDATVTDINQRMVSNRQSFVVHGGEYYIGLKPDSFFTTAGDEFVIHTLALSPDEEALPGRTYTVQVKRLWWESVRKAGNGGRLYWESERKEDVVQEFEVTSAAQPVDLSVDIEKVGFYEIAASGTDSRGNVIASEDYFYALGSGYAAWLRDNDDAVELVAERDEYQPGDVARVLVKSPYERVKALVTIEREGILDRWVEEIDGSADTIEIPIKPEYIPNAYVGVILIQGRIAYDKIEDDLDLGKPGFKIGYAGFRVNPSERRLSVELATGQEEYRPGSEVEVQLQVRDHTGQGREAEVVLSVVDVGVLNLIGYATPDPFDYFYRERPLAVLTSELRNSIVGQRNYSEKGERKAGGGLDAAAMMREIELRGKFKPTAYHNPAVRTDSDGTATVRFTLPDNLTAFRIMATAHTPDSFFGADDMRITVNKPLMLNAALPAFLRKGDTINAGVLAHNRTDLDSAATVQAEADGVELTGGDTQEVELPHDDKREVLFTYRADEERDATFTFRGLMEGETDGLEVTLPVLLHRLPLTTALFGSTTDAVHQEWVDVPEDAEPGWGNLKVSMSSTVFTDIKGSLEYVFGYPYACLEQQISRILPIILAEDLITAFDLTVFEDDDYRQVVQTTLDGFGEYQTANGGFGYWKRPYRPSPFVSAYAVFTLAMAKAEGYAVDEDVEHKAVQYLENVLKGQNERQTAYRYNDLAWNATDAFILYALTLHDKYQPAYATRLYEVRSRLPLFGKALLLKAVTLANGDSGSGTDAGLIAETLLDELLNAVRVEARTAYFDDTDSDGLAWIHGSNVRATAAVSQTLMEIDGANAANEALMPKVLEWLLRERQQKLHWRTTQENLYVFWALSTYLNVFEGTEPDFTGIVTVNSKEVLNELFQGRATRIAEEWVLLDTLDRQQRNTLEFRKDGDGRMYYTAALTYLPKDQSQPIDAGIAVQKAMTVVKGAEAGDDGAFNRGDIVRVDLTITTPRDRLFVFVDDPLPAGFKAINLGLKTADQSLRQYLEEDSPFRNSEFQDDRVVFYADYVGQGVYTVSYLVSAEHGGRFNLPPTFSGEMYTPEVFGQTGARVIEIR